MAPMWYKLFFESLFILNRKPSSNESHLKQFIHDSTAHLHNPEKQIVEAEQIGFCTTWILEKGF